MPPTPKCPRNGSGVMKVSEKRWRFWNLFSTVSIIITSSYAGPTQLAPAAAPMTIRP